MTISTNRATILLVSEGCGGINSVTGMLEWKDTDCLGRTGKGHLGVAFQYLQGGGSKERERGAFYKAI